MDDLALLSLVQPNLEALDKLKTLERLHSSNIREIGLLAGLDEKTVGLLEDQMILNESNKEREQPK